MGRWVLWCLAILLVVFSSAARAEGSFRIEGAPAFALTSPQNRYYSGGGEATGLVAWELASVFDVEAGLRYLLLPGTSLLPAGLKSPGSMLLLGAGGRLKWPKRDSLFMPWVEALIGVVGTGPLARFGLQGAIGFGFRANTTSAFLFGPVVRASYLMSAPEVGYTSADAAFLSAGLQIEILFGAPAEAPPTEPPLVSETADRDGDGVPDLRDECPDEGGPQSNKGCPDPDPDHDGVFGARDRCPQQAGPAESNGCPDRDGDTVPDAVDDCPERAGAVENGGCPVYRAVKVTETRIEINEKIFFAFGKALILDKSFEVLDEVVKALSDHGKICVRIAGHTDSKGNPEQNLKLSADRAESVLNYLVSHGIDGTRQFSKGLGDTEPLDDNRTTEGREKNRRVEFVITKCQGVAP